MLKIDQFMAYYNSVSIRSNRFYHKLWS